MMRVGFAFLALMALCFGQTTLSPCASLSRAQCTVVANTRCIFVEGKTCDGRVFGGCVDAAACGNVVACARLNINPSGVNTEIYVTFGTSCIPQLNFTVVNDFTKCICNTPVSNPPTLDSKATSQPETRQTNVNTPTDSKSASPTNQETTINCPRTCPNCSYCDLNKGACVYPTYSDPLLGCSANSCPAGSTCDTTNQCFKRCIPGCPTGSPVQCLVDPCSLPYPPNCPTTSKCVASYCGGCNRRFFDGNGVETCLDVCTADMCGPQPASPSVICPDGSVGGNLGKCERNAAGACAWVFRDCPNPCVGTTANTPLAQCTLYCPYGFDVEVTNFTVSGGKIYSVPCPVCRCKVPPPTCQPCTAVVCPPTASGASVNPVLDKNNCCPICPTPCDGVMCPQVACANGYLSKVLPGTCCPTCIPNTTCDPANCPQVPNPCPPGSVLVKKECCAVCERRIDCSLVKCSVVQCPTNFKLVFGDGDCCPHCEYKPLCDANTAANCAPCPTGTAPVKSDLACCPICQPVDFCATVSCAVPNCTLLQQIKRPGQCCNQCPTCKDTPNVLCDPADNGGCKSGFFTGPNCDVPVPSDQRVSKSLVFIFCRKDATTCDVPDTQTVRVLVAALSGADANLITVEILGKLDGNVCCIKVNITITAVKGGGVDVDLTSNTVSNKLVATGDWTADTAAASGTVKQSGTTNAASSVSVFVALALAIIALLL